MSDTHRLLTALMGKTIATAGSGGRIVRDVGGFAAAVHPTDDLIYLSCALPQPALTPADVTPAVVAELRAFFARHGRVARFEFFEPLHPWLADRLSAHGFRSQGDMPLMVCGPGDLRPAPPPPAGVTLLDLTDAADAETIRGFLVTAKTAFGEPPTATDAEVADQRRKLADGVYRSAYATVGGHIVGVASVSPANDELVGVGTLPAHRRRGVATALSARLVADHLSRGAELAWLSAGDASAEAAYGRVGFRPVGVQQNYIEAGWDGRTRAGGAT